MSRVLGIVLCMMVCVSAKAAQVQVQEPSQGAVGQSLYWIVTATGVIKSVKGYTFVFEYRDRGEPKTVTVSFNNATNITFNGKKCKMNEIKPDTRAQVKFRRAASQKDGNYTCTGLAVHMEG